MNRDIFVRVWAAFEMTVRALGVVVLSSALPGLLGCDASPLHSDVATDGRADGPRADGPMVDRSRCSGEAVSCVQGGPLGDGVACGDFAMPSICVEDRWTCPSGTVDTRSCTCGFPGKTGCTTCTRNGWVCPDAGVDAEAGTDGPRCCPRAPVGGGGCVNLGGAANGLGCFTTCDFWCSTNWRVELDAQGCEFWAMDYRLPKPGENLACSPDFDGGSHADASPDAAKD